MQASRTLLFLRNVKRIEVFRAGDDGTPVPRFQFGVSVKGREPGSKAAEVWDAIPQFIDGRDAGARGAAKLSREALYAKLARTNPRDLPRSQQLVTVACEEAGAEADATAAEKDAVDGAAARATASAASRVLIRKEQVRLLFSVLTPLLCVYSLFVS